jgi:hypothetical protein
MTSLRICGRNDENVFRPTSQSNRRRDRGGRVLTERPCALDDRGEAGHRDKKFSKVEFSITRSGPLSLRSELG